MTLKELELVREVLSRLEWDNYWGECFLCQLPDNRRKHDKDCAWLKAKTLVDRDIEEARS